MIRHIGSLTISKEFKKKLLRNGIETINEINALSVTDLMQNLGFSKQEMQELLMATKIKSEMESKNVFEMLDYHDETNSYIPTSLNSLDDVLHGIPTRKITEIVGAAGVGKTQFCLQLSVNVQVLNKNLRYKSIFIDSEGSFVTKRLLEIADAALTGVCDTNISSKDILSNIYYYRCTDYMQLLSTIYNLDKFLQSHKDVKLVIIDSLAYLFRFSDSKDSNLSCLRSNIISILQSTIYRLANKYNLAIVLTNQMTTKLKMNETNSISSNLAPYLGEIWSHFPNLRLILAWNFAGHRRLVVGKSSDVTNASIAYKITIAGLSDITQCDASDSTENRIAKKRRAV